MVRFKIKGFAEGDIIPCAWGNKSFGKGHAQQAYNFFVNAMISGVTGIFDRIYDVQIGGIKIDKVVLDKKPVIGMVDNKKIFQFRNYLGDLKIKVKLYPNERKIKIKCSEIPLDKNTTPPHLNMPTIFGIKEISNTIMGGLEKQLAKHNEKHSKSLK